MPPQVSKRLLAEFRGGVKLEIVWNMFDSIQWLCNSIDQKSQKVFKKFNENWFEFDSFDYTPILGWILINRNWIRSKCTQFNSKIWNSIDSKGRKYYEKI